MPSPSTITTIADLPDDLLAHVLRFATGAARRDNADPPPVPLSAFRLAAVSTAFRRAFLKHLPSLSLTHLSARRLADLDWRPLAACTSLRRIVVGPDAPLTDPDLVRLFHALYSRGVRLRNLDITLDRLVTQTSALHFAAIFGPHITHFALRVVCSSRRARRLAPIDDPHVVYHAHPALHLPQPPPMPLTPLPPPPQVPPDFSHQMIHIFDGIPALSAQAGFANLDDIMANQPVDHPPLPTPQQIQLHSQHFHAQWQNLPIATAPHPNAIYHPTPPPLIPNPNMAQFADQDPDLHLEHDGGHNVIEELNHVMELVDNALPDMFQPMEADPVPDDPPGFAPPMQMIPLPNVDDIAVAPATMQRSPISLGLMDDDLATILAHMPSLRHVRIDRARHVIGTSILPLAQCHHLESLVLTSNQFISSFPLKNVLAQMTNLRVLRLRETARVCDIAISAICNGPSRKTLRFLELRGSNRITDVAIRKVVNACENLERVHLSDCPKITCEGASHLSCALRLKEIHFKPLAEFPLTNRTSVHFSCASSTLQSLELVGCRRLSLDGILALGNLPGLRRLHLRGLSHVSQDVMRQLGIFPKIDDLLLEGSMHLTDLGIKVLIAQRGHRFLHLGIIDSTKNLSDEALDCMMTWCVSLRSLEVHGQFKPGAIDRLEECMPCTSLTVVSAADNYQHRPGKAGVWDPILHEIDVPEGWR